MGSGAWVAVEVGICSGVGSKTLAVAVGTWVTVGTTGVRVDSVCVGSAEGCSAGGVLVGSGVAVASGTAVAGPKGVIVSVAGALPSMRAGACCTAHAVTAVPTTTIISVI